ncbi:hypothetical protein ACP70R_020478 [Stipagrostis hirtigluma subsp. patula]
MEGRGRSLCVVALLVSAIAASLCGEAAAADGYGQPAAPATGGGPDTNVLCVSKCGTCPTVCSSPPPPSSSPSSSSSSQGTAITPPSSPKSGGGGGSSSPPGQNKGGHPSNYYYFFTAGGGRTSGRAGWGVYALVSLAVVSLLSR